VSKRIGVFSDFHTGHRVGLTPPEYFAGKREWVQRQAARWKWFTETVKEHGPFDAAIFLGDLVDGLGVKDSSECIIADLNSQIDAAAQIVRAVEVEDPAMIFMVYGTPVHVRTKQGFELEEAVAEKIGCEIHGQIWVEYDKYTIDCRHAPAGNSQVYPANPLVKERESNIKWHMEGAQVLANIYFRGHCHRLYDVGQPNRWSAHAVPALQDVGTKYGRQLSNLVQMGWGTLDILEGLWPIWTVYEAPRWQETPFKL